MSGTGTSLVLRERVDGWDDIHGDYTEYLYEGTEGAVRGAAQGHQDNGAFDTQVISAADVGAWRLRVRYNYNPESPTGEVPTFEFRMDPGRTLVSILEPPYEPTVGQISRHNIIAIKDAIASNSQGLSTDGGATEDAAQDLWRQLVYGGASEYRIVYRPTFTIVRTASANFIWPDQTASVGQLYLVSTMLADVSALVGAQPNFTLPQSTYDNSGAAALNLPNWHYGWLKHQPTYDTIIGGKTTESIDWEYGLWGENTYGTPA